MDQKNYLPQVVFSDFDGTLTYGTELTPKIFHILELLKKKGIPLIIVTGRSISWGHFLLTHFSQLDFVITEGGGSIVKRGKGQELVNEFLVPDLELEELSSFTKCLLAKFENISLSADSVGRVSDRAIELEEFDVNLALKSEVELYMKDKKIHYSTSSVHLNFWKGDISKFKAVTSFLEKYLPNIKIENTCFFGDSLNDQSMFKMMENSIGVSNIKNCISELVDYPKVVLEGDENIGANGVFNYLEKLLK